MDKNKKVTGLDNMVNKVIATDLKVSSDSNLASKIMARIEGQQVIRVSLYQQIFRISAIAACILMAATLGVYLGGVYTDNVYTTSAYVYQDGITVDDALLEKMDIIDVDNSIIK